MTVLSEKTWQRHANPWSGFTRIISFPLLYIPIWFLSDFFTNPLKYWYVVFVGILVIIWYTLNPKLFHTPKDFHHYLSRGVLGEKIWTEDRKKDAIALILTLAMVPFFLLSIAAAYLQLFWPTLFFAVVPYLLKLWFIDRMVFLYDQSSH